MAGLCHACYGTDGFPASLLASTNVTCSPAGSVEQAEAWVYLYASCDRERRLPRPARPGTGTGTGTAAVPGPLHRRDVTGRRT